MRTSADWMASKRRRARAGGLCITCCKRKPEGTRSVCIGCAKRATARTARRRQALHPLAAFQKAVAVHEQAGDLSRGYHLYDDAAQSYQHALNVQKIPAADRFRIAEKLANVLYLGGNPASAISVTEVLVADSLRSRHRSSEIQRTIEILIRQVQLLRLDSQTEKALSLMHRAIQLIDKHHIESLRKRVYVEMVHCLQSLGRASEARSLLETVEIDDGDDSFTREKYYLARGILKALFNNAGEAFEDFDRAIAAVSETPDVERIAFTWGVYSYWAWVLGDIDRNKACGERALLLARKFNIAWYIPFACLNYAETLFLLGQYEVAHNYLLEALSSHADAPQLADLFADVGIPLALIMNDEAAAKKCARAGVVDKVFQSAEPILIPGAAAAFAQWHNEKGNITEGQALVHRALRTLQNAEIVPGLFCFCIAAARYGALRDIRAARKLLQQNSSCLPIEIAQAQMDLFDAFAAERRGKRKQSQLLAARAFDYFTTINWQRYADIARSLLPGTIKGELLIQQSINGLSTDIVSLLTLREQEIAQLVLRGLTSREIAERLSISRYTVDSHVNSIMNRLGIHSRHQLVYVLAEPEPFRTGASSI